MHVLIHLYMYIYIYGHIYMYILVLAADFAVQAFAGLSFGQYRTPPSELCLPVHSLVENQALLQVLQVAPPLEHQDLHQVFQNLKKVNNC